MADYGTHLGIAFQLIDDILDYTADSVELGKNAGDDLAEGKPTLPLIYAMQDGDPATRDAIVQALVSAADSGDNKPQDVDLELPKIIEMVRASGAIDRTYELAQKQVESAVKAIQPLPPSSHKDALVSIVESSVARRF